VGKLEAVGLRR